MTGLALRTVQSYKSEARNPEHHYEKTARAAQRQKDKKLGKVD